MRRILTRDPRFLLAAIAFLGILLVQSGELGTSDTTHRLQTTHSFWTTEPAVFPAEFPEFGLIGRGGKLYSWYGIGQSLVMLPADLGGSLLERLPWFAGYAGNDPSIRAIFVSFSMNLLIATCTALVAWRLLQQMEFSVAESAAGVLVLLFGTTHLHYSQNMSENNLILLLTLTGFSCHLEWLRTQSGRILMLGAAALGLNLLTRLTTALDVAACTGFVLLALKMEGAALSDIRLRLTQFARTAIPVYGLALLLDRMYQKYRFGSFLNTYMSVFGEQQRRLNPALPHDYPFEGRFLDGFLGPLFQPEKSIFLFDPLLVLGAVAPFLLWSRMTAAVRAFAVGSWALLFAYISFYAKYTVWSGEFAWGDRYVSSAAELATLLAVPLFLRYKTQVAGWLRFVAAALVFASVAVQLASLCFWLPLEIYQMETLGHPTFVIALRFKNILAFALGRQEAWGLTNHAMREDPWDYVHITCWNFLPFLLRRVGAASRSIVDLLLLFWTASFAALVWLLLRLGSTVRRIGSTRIRAVPRYPEVRAAAERHQEW